MMLNRFLHPKLAPPGRRSVIVSLVVALGLVGWIWWIHRTSIITDAHPRVIIISIDGLRPDVALRADMRNLRQLMKRGAYSFWARTTEISITLPSHTSMLTGIVENRHEIYWNYDIPDSQMFHPPYPSILDLAKEAGYSTAMSVGKSKLREIPGKEAVDFEYLPDDYAQNQQVAVEAARIIRQHQPQVMFVHFPDTDAAGHGSGWGSDAQVRAAVTADQGIGMIESALQSVGLLDRTTILVTADHGGSGHSHGPDDPRARHIPWVIAGPDTRQNYDLTLNKDLVINTEDTFGTACWLLGIPLPEDCDGKPITLAFNDPPEPPVEAMRDSHGHR